ncbi:hypothetical protein TanjilG_16018 [Lupinus angustifolius]|uniref:Uncharacterized protein n=1 Tax=Lupinus angustifolius TaxID=3871 RepID=A0A4P1RH77_LUPAN|nr:hypothetical protein TanjilG_16018 [Lupinus angustifolius]
MKGNLFEFRLLPLRRGDDGGWRWHSSMKTSTLPVTRIQIFTRPTTHGGSESHKRGVSG